MPDDTHIHANVERFSGFADTYDRYRPQPPAVLVDILAQLAGTDRPALVVDLGCGTGLSTRIWADRAQAVVGIEPGDDMRREAEVRTTAPNFRYQSGFGHATGLPDACADIVTVSQALHWMEPEPTFAEIARILRPGGVFAVYDCDWPPAMHWEAEAAYNACMERVREVNRAHGLTSAVKSWPKHEHLARMQASGRFRYTREILVHNIEMGNAERLIGLALSQGHVATPLKHGISEDELGLTDLRAVAARVLDDDPQPWYFSYRVRLGVK
jgi:SAM-dependent methyltransferase